VSGAPRTSGPARFVAPFAGVLALAVGAVVVLDAWSKTGFRCVWDDAYMYVRYADHLRAGLGLRWNPGEPPTFGLTALLHLAPVALLRSLRPESDDFALLAASAGGGVLMVAALAWIAWRATRGATGRGLALAALLFGTFALGGPTAHFATGMDTTLDLAVLAAFVVAVTKAPEGAVGATSRGGAIALGAFAAALFLVRPDLLLFAAAALLASWLGAGEPTRKRRALLAGIVATAVVALELAVARAYFGSALPLPFYAKAAHHYGAAMEAKYAQLAAQELAAFARNHALLIALALSPLLGGARRRRSAFGPVELGLLLASVAFAVWYRFFVLQVMPYGQRFYQPLLPPLLHVSARAAAAWLRDPPFAVTPARARVAAAIGAAGFAAALVPTISFGGARLAEVVALTSAGEVGAGGGAAGADGADVTAGLLTAERLRESIFAARELPGLPSDLVLAGTEIGYLGMRAGRRRVVDLCGLHDPDFARHGFSAERLLERDRPDLLFLPVRDYAEMRAAILGHPSFRADYEVFSRQRVRGLGFALRRSGRHYAELRRLAEPWLLDPAKSDGGNAEVDDGR
jgi:hypothetical protein